MTNYNPNDFEELLDTVKHNVENSVECGDIKPIESNFNTKGMLFKAIHSPDKVGTIIVGEDNGSIAADIAGDDGLVRSFILKDNNDVEGIKNITGWIKQNYK